MATCWTYFVVVVLVFVGQGRADFGVTIVTDGSYRLVVNGNTWLNSGFTFFNNNGTQYSTLDNSLKLLQSWTTSGHDVIGQWQSTNFDYQAGSLAARTTIKTYNYPALPLAVFSQTYLGAASKTSAPDSKHVISSFPCFQSLSNGGLGFLAYGGDMAGYSELRAGTWQYGATFATGISGGPLVIFDSSDNALVISPLSQFMAASNQWSQQYQQLSYGIMGLVDDVPQNYSMDFVVYYSDRGINQAMKDWGRFMRVLYRRDESHRLFGTTLNYMGYWTDNGAYYYYNTEPGKNYQTTVLDAVKYINDLKIPFQYTQYDSWWYKKGHKNGALSWTPMPEVFPDGFKYLSDQVKLPFSCHNRYWDSETPYARYNGGRYNFIADPTSGLAVPDDDQFWIDLFNMTQQWGAFIMYEQDWLDVETDSNRILQSDLFIGRRWLVGMGKGADLFRSVGIQYCMSYSRHILQSLEIPTVSQARVSGDYSPGGKQWNIGITSMFVDAVGVAPFKDTFWTTEVQAGSPYGNKTEPQTRLNSVIATLSTGPVGPGDGIGFINLTVLMRCCDSAGRILQPSKPATAVDDQIKRMAFPVYPGPDGEVYTTYSNISGFIFGVVVAADLKNTYDLTPSSGWTFGKLPLSVVYSGTDPAKLPIPFSDSSPLHLGPECTTVNFCLYYTSPVLQMGVRSKVVILGELDKWVPVSPKRFSLIQQTTDDINVIINVNQNETVAVSFVAGEGGPLQTIFCRSPSNGPALISLRSKVILLGEPDKWVPLSPKRYYGIQQTSSDVIILLMVNAQETVTFRYMMDLGPVQTVVCDNSNSPAPAVVSTISIAQRTCTLG